MINFWKLVYNYNRVEYISPVSIPFFIDSPKCGALLPSTRGWNDRIEGSIKENASSYKVPSRVKQKSRSLMRLNVGHSKLKQYFRKKNLLQ